MENKKKKYTTVDSELLVKIQVVFQQWSEVASYPLPINIITEWFTFYFIECFNFICFIESVQDSENALSGFTVKAFAKKKTKKKNPAK